MIGDIVYRRSGHPEHRESIGIPYIRETERPFGYPWCHTQDVRLHSVHLTREYFARSIRFGPDAVDAVVLADWQAGACAVCGLERSLIKDHDHETDLVRGLICAGCNTWESYPSAHSSRIEDNSGADLTIRRYLRMPPTRLLGLTVHYSRVRRIDPVAVALDWHRGEAEWARDQIAAGVKVVRL